MTSTVGNARDEIYALWQEALNGATLPAGFKTFWDDTKDENSKERSPWARISVRHTAGGQSSISGGLGKRRYSRTGTVYVNLFAEPGDGLRVLDPLVKIALDAFEGKATPSQVWFTKSRVREQGILKGWYQINVLFDFNYDEVK